MKFEEEDASEDDDNSNDENKNGVHCLKLVEGKSGFSKSNRLTGLLSELGLR